MTEFCIRLVRPLATAQGQIESRRGFVLALESDRGERGIGEASPAYWLGGEQIAETRKGLEWISRMIDNRRDPDDLRGLLDENISSGAPLTPAARCALDTALIDLIARRRGIPMAALLGGEAIEPVPVSALFTGRTPAELADEARIAAGQGHTSFKLKVGTRAASEDAKMIEALRIAVGEHISIRLDANRAWTLEQAEAALRAFHPYGIEFVEEPLRAPAPGDLRRLREASGTALALDESIADALALEAFIEHDVADYLIVKAARLGGPTRCVEIARLAQAAGIEVVVTDSIESAAGMSAAIHLASVVSRRGTAAGMGGVRLLSRVSSCGVEFPTAAQVIPAGPGLNVSA